MQLAVLLAKLALPQILVARVVCAKTFVKSAQKSLRQFVDNYHNDSVAVTRINLDLDRVSLDAIDGGGTDLGQHGVNCHRRVAGVQARDLRSGWRSQCPP